MVKRRHFDIVVVGAGMAGSALVAALAGSGLDIALVEGAPMPTEAPVPATTIDAFDPRVSALTEASRGLLADLGAWSRIEALAVCPYRHMTVWDAEGTGEIEFDASLVDRKELGHIVENRMINWGLQQSLSGSGVELYNPVRVAGLMCHTGADIAAGDPAYELELEDGRQVAATLLVAADGAVSTIRRLAGLETREWDYQHTAIVCTVATSKGHHQTAWQRFLPTGPLGLLPLLSSAQPERYCSIVWSAEPDYAQSLLGLDDQQFCAALGAASEFRLGEIDEVSTRYSFPLHQRHAVDYIRPGLALVADAAHSIHPLAGQGINLGFKDVQVLAEEIKRGCARGLAPGDEQLLKRYQRRRMADNLAMMGAMEGFKRLFAARPLPLRWLRNEGMSMLNRHSFLKSRIIRQAMGIQGATK